MKSIKLKPGVKAAGPQGVMLPGVIYEREDEVADAFIQAKAADYVESSDAPTIETADTAPPENTEGKKPEGKGKGKGKGKRKNAKKTSPRKSNAK